jgi:hypothetical protein
MMLSDAPPTSSRRIDSYGQMHREDRFAALAACTANGQERRLDNQAIRLPGDWPAWTRPTFLNAEMCDSFCSGYTHS